MFGNPMEIAILVGAAVLLFGADKVPKLARGLGQAKKEFMVGQAEAEVAAERARAEARAQAEAAAAAAAKAQTETPPTQPTPPATPAAPQS
jgi:sec-independent protein translocase protein TatA